MPRSRISKEKALICRINAGFVANVTLHAPTRCSFFWRQRTKAGFNRDHQEAGKKVLFNREAATHEAGFGGEARVQDATTFHQQTLRLKPQRRGLVRRGVRLRVFTQRVALLKIRVDDAQSALVSPQYTRGRRGTPIVLYRAQAAALHCSAEPSSAKQASTASGVGAAPRRRVVAIASAMSFTRSETNVLARLFPLSFLFPLEYCAGRFFVSRAFCGAVEYKSTVRMNETKKI